MGIYDRDYYRQEPSGFRLRAPSSAVVAIILLNVAVFVLEVVDQPAAVEAFGHRSTVVDLLSTHVSADAREDTLRRPWMWWQFLTYGFVHDPGRVDHILFNMMVLFFLGRDVEKWYGTREFIRLYLVTLVFSALVWTVTTRLADPPDPHHPRVLLGASGAITGVVMLFALNFPKRILLVNFFIPMPAWLMGALVIAFDIWGAIHRGDNVAYTAHLGGAALALAYFNLRWNFGQFFAGAAAWLKGRTRPSLKVFKPENEFDAHVTEEDVDHILEKIHREGEGSLTRKERRILENASREYQRRRHPE